jgi:hypothetical protein
MPDTTRVEADEAVAPSPASPRASRRRRVWLALASGALVIGLVTAVVLTVGAIARRPHPFTADDAYRAGLPVIIGDTLFRPDGTSVSLRLPPGDRIGQFAVVPSGLLALVYHQDPDDLGVELQIRLIRPTGASVDLATSVQGDFAVTPDGSTVVTTGGSGVALQSIDIATAKPLQAIRDGAWSVVALNGSWALLRSATDGYVWRDSRLWNVRTGKVIPFATFYGVAPWGVTQLGDVLRAVDPDPPPRTDVPSRACVDLVTPVGTGRKATVPTAPTGYCGTFAVSDATVSPTGTWAVLTSWDQSPGHGVVAVRIADLHAGRWAPVTIHEADGTDPPLFWDSFTSFIAPYVTGSGGHRYERCSVDGTCHDLGIPGNAVVGRPTGG